MGWPSQVFTKPRPSERLCELNDARPKEIVLISFISSGQKAFLPEASSPIHTAVTFVSSNATEVKKTKRIPMATPQSQNN